MKPKDIFGLAVRLLGLYFLYLGLYAFAQMLNSDVFESPDKSDIVNGLLPVVFDLLVACWLISGVFIIRWAYRETPKISENVPSAAKRPAPSLEPVPAPGLTGMDRAEKKLEALVEKNKAA
jgi:uncharacterized membrane protein (DUF485 family)